MRNVQHDSAEPHIVFNYQKDVIIGPDAVSIVVDLSVSKQSRAFRRTFHVNQCRRNRTPRLSPVVWMRLGQVQRESTSPRGLAHHANLAAQQLCEFPANRQSQPGPTEFASRTTFHLLEG